MRVTLHGEYPTTENFSRISCLRGVKNALVPPVGAPKLSVIRGLALSETLGMVFDFHCFPSIGVPPTSARVRAVFAARLRPD